jgi:hypothetical protein
VLGFSHVPFQPFFPDPISSSLPLKKESMAVQPRLSGSFSLLRKVKILGADFAKLCSYNLTTS